MDGTLTVTAMLSRTILRLSDRMRGAWLLVFALSAAIYFRVVSDLFRDWWRTPEFSYGFLVPAFSAYLIWERRARLVRIQCTPSWSGPPVVALGLLALILGTFAAEFFLSRLSLLIVLAGLILSCGGHPLLRELRSALAVLVLAIPIPTIVFNQITLPLQLFASGLASDLLPLIGAPVLQEGNVLVFPELQLEVAEACSGIRSIMSLLTLSAFYGYFLEHSTTRRVLLILSSIPIAITGNVLRLLGTGFCIRHWKPETAMGFFHEFSGWVTYIVSFACLFLFHRLLCLLAPKEVRT
jgi:exosortase